MSLLDNFLGTSLGQVAGAGLAYEGLDQALSNIGELRTEVTGPTPMSYPQIAQTGGQAAAFQPFTVTSGMGSAQFGAGGGLTSQLGQQPAAIQQALLGQLAGQTQLGGMGSPFAQQAMTGATTALGQAQQPLDTATQNIFQQIRATQMPEEERQRIELENRLAAQGRLGTQTSLYGGTPEALALAKAQEEARSNAALQARQMASGEQQQALQQAAGMFGLGQQAQLAPSQLQQAQLGTLQAGLQTAFLPEQQMLSSLSPALQAAQLAQAGRASEAELLGALGPAYLQAMTGLGETEAALEQARVNAVLQALGIQESAKSAALNAAANQALSQIDFGR